MRQQLIGRFKTFSFQNATPEIVAASLAIGIVAYGGCLILGNVTGHVMANDSYSMKESFAANRRPSVSIESIVAAHLFGEAVADELDFGRPEAGLVLAGTVVSSIPGRSRAIAGIVGGRTRLLAVNDQLGAGYIVKEIRPRSVMLERNGMRSLISLVWGLTPATFTADRAVAAVAATGAVSAPSAGSVPDVPDAIDGNWGESDYIRAQPVGPTDARLKAVRLYPVGDHEVFMNLGLKPGDVVTAINGSPLGTYAEVGSFFKGILNGGGAALTVMRGNHEQIVNVNPGVALAHRGSG
jgi:general secretion pathway protein C